MEFILGSLLGLLWGAVGASWYWRRDFKRQWEEERTFVAEQLGKIRAAVEK